MLPGDRPRPNHYRYDAARHPHDRTRPDESDVSNACPKDLRYLTERDLRLKKNIIFSRRCIRPAITSVDRDEVANISQPLILQKQPLDLPSCEGAAEVPKCEVVTLKVPHPYPSRTYPEFLFGVSSLSDRLHESRDTFAAWLSGSGAKFVGIVADRGGATDETLAHLRTAFRDAGIDAEFVLPPKPKLSASRNHFAMVRDLVRAADARTKWIGIIDDDTFFPSLHPVAEALGKLDHTREQYAGALSEDFRAIQNWGYMAFGGAGMFLSVPAARLVDENLERCLEEGSNGEGDGLLRDCVYRHTHAKLTQIKGLHQQDMMGDVSGFYEAGLRPASLHHWKSWHHVPVDRMSLVSHVCGDCFLQRWRFGEDTVLSNGYSISVYKDGVRHLELDRTEASWGDHEFYEFSLGPFREKIEEGGKKSYVLADAELLPSGDLRQVYVHRTRFDSSDPDEVVELFWNLDGK